jgi:hypothetical protein
MGRQGMRSLKRCWSWVKEQGWWFCQLGWPQLFSLTEYFAFLAAIFFVILWFCEADDRTKERHYRAWELINSARGSTGDGGRKDALHDLSRDGISLAAAPLENAYLRGVNLECAKLKGADLTEASLKGADLTGADLEGAHLERRTITHIAGRGGYKLGEVGLKGANLEEADLTSAKLDGANFDGVNLTAAFFDDVDLRNVSNLVQEQLNAAYGVCIYVLLPDHLRCPEHWLPDTDPYYPEHPFYHAKLQPSTSTCGRSFLSFWKIW